MSFTVSLSVLGGRGRRELDQQDNIPTYNSAIRCLLKKNNKTKTNNNNKPAKGHKAYLRNGKEIILLRKT